MGSILASISWPFWYQLGSILEVKIHEKSMPRGFQDASFSWSILVSISNAFGLRFGGQLASNLGPKTRQDGARSRPGAFQRRFQNGADFRTSFKSAIPQLWGRPGGMRRARGRLQRGCRKLVKGQSLERRRLLKGLRITDFDVR